MLRVRQRSDQARLLDDRDRAAALEVCAADPVANVFVESRIRVFGARSGAARRPAVGLRAGRAAGVAVLRRAPTWSRCRPTPPAVAAFADRALRQGRRCSSIVGPSAAVSELWGFLRPYWGPARDVRAAQPLMAIDGPPPVAADPGGQARPRSTRSTSCCPPPSPCSPRRSASPRWPATAARPTGRGSASWSASGRAFARIEDGRVIFKAEVGAATPRPARCRASGSARSTAAGASPPPAWPPWSTRPASRSPRWSRSTSTTSTPPAAPPTSAPASAEVGEFMSVLF